MPEENTANRPAAPHPASRPSTTTPNQPTSAAPPPAATNHAAPAPAATPGAATTGAQSPSAPPAAGQNTGTVDLGWVWLEVRKRVFIKLPFSRQVAEVMEAVVPIALEDNHFICGLPTAKFPLSSFLISEQVKNTIEGILRQAGGQTIHFEVIEGTTYDDWKEIRERRERAQQAVMAMAEHHVELHHFEDVLNQIAGEVRHRISATRDRNFPQVRAQLILDIVPQLSDTVDMLFPGDEGHEAGRILARTLDRIAGFLDMPPLTLAIEMERYHREQVTAKKTPPRPSPADTSSEVQRKQSSGAAPA